MARIMIIVPYLSDGGAERVVARWSNILSRNGETICCLTFIKKNTEYTLDDDVIRRNLFEDEINYNRFSFSKNAKEMIRVIEEFKPDILIPFLSESLLLCHFARGNKKIKILATIRNNPWMDPSNKILRLLRDYFVKKSDGVIFQNDEQVEYFKNFKKGKFIVCNPITQDFLNIQKSEYRKVEKIIAVGRLCEQKNYAMMIKAIAYLNQNGYNFSLDIYGDGPQKDNILKVIEKENMTKFIKLCGRKSNVIEIEKDYDLFIMTSKYEGFPNALLEAMTIGMPVISTSCLTGPKSMIKDNCNGILLKTFDYHELASKIIEINDCNQLSFFGENARRDCLNKFTEDVSFKQLFNAISSCLRGG